MYFFFKMFVQCYEYFITFVAVRSIIVLFGLRCGKITKLFNKQKNSTYVENCKTC